MDVIFHILGDVVVDDDVHAGGVDASGGHIGGDEQVGLAGFELAHHTGARPLGHVAVETLHGQTHLGQLPGEHLYHAFGVAEDQATVGALLLKQQAHALCFFGFGHLHIVLGDEVEGGIALVALDGLRIPQEPLGQPQDGRRHGGGEQGGLPVFGGVEQDLLDVVHEAHVQHLVGLVQDGQADIHQLQGAAAQMVDDAAGGAHHHGGFFQGADLGVDVLAAVDGDHPQPFLVFGKFAQFIADLHGQLTGGAEDQHLGVGVVVRVHHLFDGGDTEGCGLAGAGAGLADHVAAGHQHGDGLLLDGGERLIAGVLNGTDHFGRQVHGFQCGDIHSYTLFFRKFHT